MRRPGAALAPDERDIDAQPGSLTVDLRTAALLAIDMQHDFCSPGGWDDRSGIDIAPVSAVVPKVAAALAAARALSLAVFHTREGHAEDLADCPPAKLERSRLGGAAIGAEGPRGRLLVRGSDSNAIVADCAPLEGERVIDKTTKDAFLGTELLQILVSAEIETIFLCGVTTECCVQSTFRTASDLGFRCVVIADACASPVWSWHESSLEVMRTIFGWQTELRSFGELSGRPSPHG